jgi:hypothetical protein
MTFQERNKNQIQWLLEGDPSIRYQTLRDLVNAKTNDINKEKDDILKKGWGKSLIELQQENGSWSNALYSPKWTSTFYTLLLLKRFGSPKSQNTEKACKLLLDKGFYPKDGGINYWKTWNQGECCVTAMLLSMLCHFKIKDERINRMVEFLVSQQMKDEGWNCEIYKGAKHSSFHTTISVLEGFWEYEKHFPDNKLTNLIRKKQNEGITFLLNHHLYKSNTTWEVVDPRMTKLSFPPRWHFDIIRCLDYFQEKKIEKDQRMNDAMKLLLKKRTVDGFWKLEIKYSAKIFFEMEKVGKESRWNTLRALRISKWWEN